MKTNDREILIYYNPESSSDKKTVAYAKSVSKHIKSFAFANSPSKGMSWSMILKSLDLHPKDLLNKAHPDYRANIKGQDFDEESWLKVLQRNPQMLKAPIAVRGSNAILCLSPTDIYKLEQTA